MDAITLRNQIESPLLSLPGEVRNRIYNYVFRVDFIEFFPNALSLALGYHYISPYLVNDIGASPPSQPLFVFLPSRSVCRQYHTETRLLIFKINTLRMSPETLPEVIQQMPKDAQDVISIIHIIRLFDWPNPELQRDLDCLASFSNLRKLEVQPAAYGDTEEDWHRKTEEWCRPYIGGAEIKVLSKDVSHPI